MFTIFTETPSEKDILEQDYAAFHDRFHVKLQEAPAIAGILRTISYELFQATPPTLAQEITLMASDALHLKLSLTLYRQVLARIKKVERLLTLYHSYFQSLAQLVDSPPAQAPPSLPHLEQETSAIYQLQNLDPTPSDHLLITDFQAQLSAAVAGPCPPSPMQKTCQTAAADPTDEELPTREPLDLSSKDVGGEKEDGVLWWRVRTEENPENLSREMSQFERHGANHALQASITDLIAEEARFEQEREQALGRKSKRSQKSLYTMLNKRMREKIVHAKLRRKKR